MPSHEHSHFSIAVEDKNTFFAFFSKITDMVVEWLYQDVVTFHSMFYNLHSYELLLGSSHPEVKVALKNFAKFTGSICAGVSFLRKLQDAHKSSETFRGNFFTGDLRTATSERSLFHDYSEKKTLFKSNNNSI